MTYLLLKHLHVSCVVLSGLGFAWRGSLMWRQSPVLQHWLARRLPHVVDSLLLGAAVALATLSGQYPGAQPWLTAKLLGLLAYIGLGMVALRRGKTLMQRRFALLLAGVAYAYIVSVALTHDSRGGLLWLLSL
jgi:uncharacterized membrane protein SirB2